LHNSTYPKVADQWLNQALCGEALLAIKSKPLGLFKVSDWLTMKCFKIVTFG
jgi:hypothetical protein